MISIIDLGTNTFNLLIAECDDAGKLVIVHRDERAVFLGRGGIEKGLIKREALDRGMQVLSAFVDKSRELGAARITAFGTSALRNASNAREFTARAKHEIGVDITVIRGDEEAALILDGARQAVAFSSKPMLVMDIGGGSIEFILATDKAVMWKRSFEIGATRLLERLTPSDPLLLQEYFRICAHLDAQLEPLFAVMDRHWPTVLVGSAGSFDTLAQLAAHETGTTISAATTSTTLSAALFDTLKDGLVGSTRAERERMPEVPDYRVDTLPLAMIAMERVMLHGIEEIRWSRYALKEGAAWRILGR